MDDGRNEVNIEDGYYVDDVKEHGNGNEAEAPESRHLARLRAELSLRDGWKECVKLAYCSGGIVLDNLWSRG